MRFKIVNGAPLVLNPRARSRAEKVARINRLKVVCKLWPVRDKFSFSFIALRSARYVFWANCQLFR